MPSMTSLVRYRPPSASLRRQQQPVSLPVYTRSLRTTPTPCSGHNKWSKIKHKKFAADAARSSVFSRFSMDIMAAVRAGGPVPENNAKLAVLINKAKTLNFPKDKLESSIAKATKSAANGQALTYELMGPTAEGGSPIVMIVETVSDNPNHNRFLIKDTISSRRRYGDCRLSSVSHMFERKGYIRATPAPDAETSEEVFATAVEAGVDDCDESRPETEEEANAVQEDGIVWEIRCQPTSFDDIVKALQAKGHVLHEAEVKLLPTAPPLRIKYEEEETDGTAEDSTDVATSGWVDTATIEKLDKLRDALEENADCQRIWSNIHGWP